MSLFRMLAAGAIAMATMTYLRHVLAPGPGGASPVDDTGAGLPADTAPMEPAEVEESMHREAMIRAQSEVASGEFDMQG